MPIHRLLKQLWREYIMGKLQLILCALFLYSSLGNDQTTNAPAAPTGQAADISLIEILEAASQLRNNGLATNRLLEGGILSINVRHIQGAETALQHGNITEVWVVREGLAVLSTGGTIVDREAGAGPGDFRGSAIQGGFERTIKAGDLVYIPTGVPHGIKETESIVYLNIRFELREPD
jgi:mannose-6-phosphate isomerase-like protein (cupin superfamily)